MTVYCIVSVGYAYFETTDHGPRNHVVTEYRLFSDQTVTCIAKANRKVLNRDHQ